MVEFLRDGQLISAGKLTDKELQVLSSDIRIQILKQLSQEPSYPAKIAKELDCSKQKIYYHFEKLQEAGLITENRTENRSGGEATYYQPSEKGFVLDLGGEGESFPLPEHNEDAINFLNPLISDGEFNGRVIVGSPDQHGPDQVRARDGHLAAEIMYKLGNYSRKDTPSTLLDTEVIREENYSQNLLMIGGVLTNVISKKFNEYLPVNFASDSFPYREIKTPHNSYTEESIGFIAKTSNPEDHTKSIYIIAGVQSKGTRAAVRAFNDLEKVVEGYSAGQFYAVVRGLDLNSDGQIDSYKVIETSE